MEVLKGIASKIWDKYVAANAAWQINVPFSTQKALQTQLDWARNDAMELKNFISIFDDCIYEVFSLMGDSYGRFKKTQRYKTLNLPVDPL